MQTLKWRVSQATMSEILATEHYHTSAAFDTRRIRLKHILILELKLA